MGGVKCVVVAAGIACGPMALAGITYDEAVDGDLSDDRLSPSVLALSDGVNSLTMDVVNSNDTVEGDRDYFTFEVAAGFELASVVVDAGNPSGGFDATAFVGLAFDDFFDFDPETFVGDGLVGFVLTGPGVVGTEVLPTLADGNATGAGDYCFWVQQTGADLTRVTLDITVTAVPAPGGLACVLVGAGFMSRRRRA